MMPYVVGRSVKSFYDPNSGSFYEDINLRNYLVKSSIAQAETPDDMKAVLPPLYNQVQCELGQMYFDTLLRVHGIERTDEGYSIKGENITKNNFEYICLPMDLDTVAGFKYEIV